jgi:hypothetical protein
LKGREVQKPFVAGRARVGVADEVWAREELARAVVVVEEVQVERIPRAERDDAVQLPAVAEARVLLPEVRHVVVQGGDEAVAVVEVGAGAFEVCAVAVVGLRGVGDVVLPVRGVVNRVRGCSVRPGRPGA